MRNTTKLTGVDPGVLLQMVGLTVVGAVCCAFLIKRIGEVPSNWASVATLVLEATAIAFGLSNDVDGRGMVCWDTPTEYGGCAHPLDEYLFCVAILAIVVVFTRFAPASDPEKWSARQGRRREEEIARLRAEDTESTALLT